MECKRANPAKQFSRWVRQKLFHNVTPAGFTPINQFLPEDIFVVGYPKSGNTWFQTLVAGAVYGVLPELVPMPVVGQLVPDVHSTRWYKRISPVMFFKSHGLPEPRHRRVIYLLRDGRDAMVSYLHYRRVVDKQDYNFLDFVRGNLFPCKWHVHVRTWMDNPYHAKMLIVRYEDLLADTVGQLRRVCEFAGIERREEILIQAAESAAFKKMQAKEKKEGSILGQESKGKLFCRRGKTGSYLDEMPGDVLEAFMEESAPMLRFCGYLNQPVTGGSIAVAAQ